MVPAWQRIEETLPPKVVDAPVVVDAAAKRIRRHCEQRVVPYWPLPFAANKGPMP